MLSPQPDLLPHPHDQDSFSFSDISSFSSSGSSSAGSVPSPGQQADLSFQSTSCDLDGLPSEDELFELMCGAHTAPSSSFDTTAAMTATTTTTTTTTAHPSALPSDGIELTPGLYPDDVFQSFPIESLASFWNGVDLGPSVPSQSVNQAVSFSSSTSSSSSSPAFGFASVPTSSPPTPPSSTTSELFNSIFSTTRLDHTTLPPPPSPQTLAQLQPASVFFEPPVPQPQEVPSFILSYLSHPQEQPVQFGRPDPVVDHSSHSTGTAHKRKAPPSPPASHSSISDSSPSVQNPVSASVPAPAPLPTSSPPRSVPSLTLPQPDQDGPNDGLAASKPPTDHNAIERKYRDNINDGFTRLRDSVPVLRALLEYILELQRERARLKRYSQFLEKRLGSSPWEDFLAADSHAILDPYLQSITTPTRPSAAPSVRSQPISSSALTRSLPPPPPPPPRKKARVTATVTTTTAATAATAGAVGGGTVMLVLGLGVGLFNPFDPLYSVDKNPGAAVVKGKVILGTQATPSSSLHATPPPLSFAAPTCLCISIVVLSLMLLAVSRSARRRFQRGVSRWTKLVVRGSGSGFPGEDEESEGKQDRLPVGWVELEGGQVSGWVGWGWKAGERENHEWISCGDRELIFPKPIISSARTLADAIARPSDIVHTYLAFGSTVLIPDLGCDNRAYTGS
ncbi:Myc-type, basic helix-loop-helix (bHLH) domain [Phaffia rhodozyma]|uniref:Myc-type, basic helix-loop-helix (BHLH) domain n=1 Tax=Phaffia rhodozyma TaxID=264483 RepID=A0A0F7SL88_PHARH|nr:Myc-type, basic helix-loop-helix (bHLH) domain [Phaffia rhodozyma]